MIISIFWQLDVENHSDRTYYFISAATDPKYYSPNETSYAVHGGLSRSTQGEMENHFRSNTFRNPILPNTAVSGFIFTNLDEGEKVVQIDLIASKKIKFFTFFVQVPGIDRLVADQTYYTRTTIPVTQFYPGSENPADVKTLGVIATLYTSSIVPDGVCRTHGKQGCYRQVRWVGFPLHFTYFVIMFDKL